MKQLKPQASAWAVDMGERPNAKNKGLKTEPTLKWPPTKKQNCLNPSSMIGFWSKDKIKDPERHRNSNKKLNISRAWSQMVKYTKQKKTMKNTQGKR